MTTSTPVSDIFALSHQLVDIIAQHSPIAATYMGVKGHDDRFDDLSPSGYAQRIETFRQWRAKADTLANMPATFADPTEKKYHELALHVYTDWLDQEIRRYEAGVYVYDLNSIDSSPQAVRMVFDMVDDTIDQTINDPEPKGILDVIARLHAVPTVLSQYRQTLQLGIDTKRTVSQRQVRTVIEQAKTHAGHFAPQKPSSFSQLQKQLEEKLKNKPAYVPNLHAGIQAAQQAYQDLADWLENTYLPHASHIEGVGIPRYQAEVRRFLGMHADAAQLKNMYVWGWHEIKALRARMQDISNQIRLHTSIPDMLDLLRNHADTLSEADQTACIAKDRAAFLQAMQDRQKMALDALADVHFDVPAEIKKLDVKFAPLGGGLGAYYMGPSEDFSRAGSVWYSVGTNEGPFALFDEISTAYHEGFPGHHLQIGIQVSLAKQLSRLHRLSYFYSGYAEGWALYSEELMGELGFYEHPAYTFGMLANQMMRACRVVFDIGAHCGFVIPNAADLSDSQEIWQGVWQDIWGDAWAERIHQAWTFDDGVSLLTRLGGMETDYAHSEVTRYLGWPAQAISYKIGQKVMLELRQAYFAKYPQGTLRDFHTRVLGVGTLGLDHLREVVLA